MKPDHYYNVFCGATKMSFSGRHTLLINVSSSIVCSLMMMTLLNSVSSMTLLPCACPLMIIISELCVNC